MHWSSDVPALLATLKRFLKRRGRSPEDAEDLIQEAFLRLERYCRRGQEVQCAEAFLRTTITNLAVSEFRAEHAYLKGRAPLDGELLRDPSLSPEDVYAAQQRIELLHRILPRREREVYFMHKFGGYSYAEIADRLSCSISLVEKILAGAVTKIAYERSHGRLREE
jgi:RNA polymerase sigma-70 factor (ECF subfamily)